MNSIDYSQLPLRDIHLPGAIGLWPPALGWWLVAALLLAIAGYFVWRYRSHFRERAALRSLRAVAAAIARGEMPSECVQRISLVMRRFAMSIADGAPVAGFTGEQWLRYLDSRWDKNTFAKGSGRLIIFGPYAPPDRVDPEDAQTLNDLCIEWIELQRRAH
jgi:hypothetical protein